MTAPKTKYPISSFGPELMAFLVKSGQEKVTLKFEGDRGYKEANRFRRRVHTLRQRMREENHSDYIVASRAIVSIFWGNEAIPHGAPAEWVDDFNHHKGALVIGRPHDADFGDVLKAAGVEVPQTRLPEPAPNPQPDGDHPPPSMLDDIFTSDFGKKP